MPWFPHLTLLLVKKRGSRSINFGLCHARSHANWHVSFRQRMGAAHEPVVVGLAAAWTTLSSIRLLKRRWTAKQVAPCETGGGVDWPRYAWLGVCVLWIFTLPACTTSQRPCLVNFSPDSEEFWLLIREVLAIWGSYFSWEVCGAMVGSLGAVLGSVLGAVFVCTVGSLVLFWAICWLYLVAVGEVLGATVGSLGEMKGLQEFDEKWRLTFVLCCSALSMVCCSKKRRYRKTFYRLDVDHGMWQCHTMHPFPIVGACAENASFLRFQTVLVTAWHHRHRHVLRWQVFWNEEHWQRAWKWSCGFGVL